MREIAIQYQCCSIVLISYCCLYWVWLCYCQNTLSLFGSPSISLTVSVPVWSHTADGTKVQAGRPPIGVTLWICLCYLYFPSVSCSDCALCVRLLSLFLSFLASYFYLPFICSFMVGDEQGVRLVHCCDLAQVYVFKIEGDWTRDRGGISSKWTDLCLKCVNRAQTLCLIFTIQPELSEHVQSHLTSAVKLNISHIYTLCFSRGMLAHISSDAPKHCEMDLIKA